MRDLCLIISTLLLLTGCTFTMVGNAPKTEDSIAQNRTVNATYASSEQFINMCAEQEENLAEIRFHTNPVYLLASLVTLGLYVPQNVTWWCGQKEEECADGVESDDCVPYTPGGE